MPRKLTEWEWKALASPWNLADGHARQLPASIEQGAWQSLPSIVDQARDRPQRSVEDDFLAQFMKLNGQGEALRLFRRPLLHYSSSVTIEIVANVARIKGWRVALVTPTFDNIADIFRRQNVPLTAVEESRCTAAKLAALTDDTIFLTLPNNPTGFELTPSQWERLISALAASGKRLIIDASFRMFGARLPTELPTKLKAAGVSFIVIEDTGKYLSALDQKCGFCWCSDDIWEPLREITDDVLLNVSPITLTLLARLCDAHAGAEKSPTRSLMNANYARVLESLALFGIAPARQKPFSVLWARLPDGRRSDQFCEAMAEKGLVLLPGESFSWDDPEQGRDYIRFAIMRDRDYVERAMSVFDSNCRQLLKRRRKA